MNRIRPAVILGLVLFAANERAVPVIAATHSASAAPIQIILRLSDPPVSGVTPPARQTTGRHQGSAGEIRRERAYFRTLQQRQEALEPRLRGMGVRIVARYRIAFNGLCVE